jgi:DNA helicase-2/ATP-dependent DNA helicase PcrA
LHVVHDPSRGDRLMRLLTGPAVRLGPRDLVALGSWSRELHRRRARAITTAGHRHPDVVVLADVVDESSLVEALDELPPAGWADADGRTLSDEALRRLHGLATTLRGLRARTALSLPELVVETERALLLDVEVASRPGVAHAVARTHLDALAQVAADFTASADRATLGAFLAWLDAAQQRERGLEPGPVEVDPDAVTLMTVHAAKGLEWDVVAVPGLVEGTFPAHGARAKHDGTHWQLGEVKDTGWLGELGALPHELRGDSGSLPDLRWAAIAEQPDVATELDGFALRGGQHELDEERRLAYVAFTRAKQVLLLSGAVWGDAATPRLPSRFVTELVALDSPGLTVLSPLQPPEADAVNPRTETARTAPWPNDPLADRRPQVEAGAALVRTALERRAGTLFEVRSDAAPTDRARQWAAEVELLLAERDRGRPSTGDRDAAGPHLGVQAGAARRRPHGARDERASADAARAIARPPSRNRLSRLGRAVAGSARDGRPRRAARCGRRRVSTRHGWGAAVDLAAMRTNFLASEWAGRTVLAVEATVETPVDGTVVRGRIDAVFARPDGGADVVDWKTGAPPTGREARASAVQLAVYRLAWSRLHGVPLDRVGAAFFYAATGTTVRPVDLLDEAGLVALLRGIDEVG